MPRKIEPGTAAYNTSGRISAFYPDTTIRRGIFVIPMPVVLAPLQDVTVHIAEAKGVGHAKVIHRSGFTSAFAFWSPCISTALVIGYLGGNHFTKVEGGDSTGSTGILPFGFGGEAIEAIGESREAGAELNGVIPGHFLDRVAIAFKH
jgi:hypothetical protein